MPLIDVNSINHHLNSETGLDWVAFEQPMLQLHVGKNVKNIIILLKIKNKNDLVK